MSSEQSFGRNKIKRLTLLGLLTAACMILGYLESLLNLSFIAPGVKIGLANAVCLCLVFTGDIKGAYLVNISRILLSALLFSSPFTLVYSLSAGLVSLTAAAFLSRLKSLSAIGVSAAGGLLHNLTQLLVAFLVLGRGVLYYTPLLSLSGIGAGALVGLLSEILIKKMKTKQKK